MLIRKVSPTRINLEGFDPGVLKPHLTYVDKSVDFELKKARHSKWLLQKMGEEAWRQHLDDLKAKRQQCLLFEDSKGLWTYSGLAWWLAAKFQCKVVDEVVYPGPKIIPWAKVPEKKMRPYQISMEEQLLEALHGGVEVGTGLGKSFVILQLAKRLGLKTLVMTPSVSIAEQIHKEFEQHLGKKYVGKFFGGKKESKKLFVIGVDDSLSRVQEDDDHGLELSKAQVFIADESHLCPAKTLSRVCFGIAGQAPYRFFFSGTQMRNDGLDLLLDAITGKIVFRMTVEEGVQQGYLAKPMFRMVSAKSDLDYSRDDANEMCRAHLLYNEEVNAKAAEIANLMVEELGRPTVILVKEIEQFAYLLPYLRHRVAFAHGGVTKQNQDKIPKQYWDSDPNALVQEFNEGKLPILVGTSCITTGTDIQAVKCIVFLRGGKSEIDLKQSIGRGTRKPPGKEDCFFVDFDVTNVDVIHRHAMERVSIYRDVYPDFEELSI